MDPQHVIMFKRQISAFNFYALSFGVFAGLLWARPRDRPAWSHNCMSLMYKHSLRRLFFFLLETCTHKQFQDIKCGRNEGDGATQTPSVSMTPACPQMLLWGEAYIENRMEYLNVCATFQSILQMLKIIPVQTKSIVLKQPWRTHLFLRAFLHKFCNLVHLSLLL